MYANQEGGYLIEFPSRRTWGFAPDDPNDYGNYLGVTIEKECEWDVYISPGHAMMNNEERDAMTKEEHSLVLSATLSMVNMRVGDHVEICKKNEMGDYPWQECTDERQPKVKRSAEEEVTSRVKRQATTRFLDAANHCYG